MAEGNFAIILGGKTFDLPALTMRQVKRICLATGDVGAGDVGKGFEAESEIILAALAGAEPDLTLEQLQGRPVDRAEMAVAVNAIWRAAGLLRSGEATAVADKTATA